MQRPTRDGLPLLAVVGLQAAAASNAQDWQVAESFFLKAKRPDAALAMYREAGQWQAALKLAEAYLPNSIQVLFEMLLCCETSVGCGHTPQI
jgi:intraflagellar transport protein 172